MTRLLHTGDTHIGYQQYHSPERRQDFLRAFETVIEDAIELDVDAVVHSGDLFQDRRPDLQDIQGVVSALRRLRDASIPFLAIVGNHEEKRDQQWLDLLADLDLTHRLGSDPYTVGDISIYGLDYVPPTERDELEYDFIPANTEHAVLVAHGLFEPFEIGDWDTERLLSESNISLDALLLGDNHEPGTRKIDDTWLTYPGSTERASATEREKRGYNIIRSSNGDIEISRRTIETRRFVFVDVELNSGQGFAYARDRVREYDHTDAVTIITIEGEGEQITPGPLEEIALEEGALIARVNDRRELDETTDDMDVSFADPDAAVREQLKQMDLSTVSRDLDQVIRDSAIADSNVRDYAHQSIEEALDEGLSSLQIDDKTSDGSSSSEPEQVDTSGDSSDDGSNQQLSMGDYL